MSISVLHETGTDLGKPGNVYELQRTYELSWRATANTDKRFKVRVTVHHDSTYPQQSRYVAEVWSGNRWSQVVRIDGEDPWARATMLSGYLPVNRRKVLREGVEAMATALVERAKEVLR